MSTPAVAYVLDHALARRQGIILIFSNATLGARHQPLLFCAPAKPALLPEHAQQMLLEIPLTDVNKGMPASLMLIGALQRSFPCKP